MKHPKTGMTSSSHSTSNSTCP